MLVGLVFAYVGKDTQIFAKRQVFGHKKTGRHHDVPVFEKTNYLKTNLLKQIKKIFLSVALDRIRHVYVCKIMKNIYILQ